MRFLGSKKFTRYSKDELSTAAEAEANILTTVGVVAALLLSLAIGVFATIPMEELVAGNYYRRLVNHRATMEEDLPFRRWIVHELEQKNFNFTKLMSDWTVLDVRKVLLEDFGDDWHDKERVFHLTKDELDLGKIKYSARVTQSDGSVANSIGWFAGLSIVLFTIAVLSSLFQYLALLWSCVQAEAAEGHSGAMAAFHNVNRIVVFVLVIFLCAGVVLFYFGMVDVARVRYPEYAAVGMVRNFGYFVAIPMWVISFLVALFSWLMPELAAKRDDEEDEEEEDDDDEQTPALNRG